MEATLAVINLFNISGIWQASLFLNAWFVRYYAQLSHCTIHNYILHDMKVGRHTVHNFRVGKPIYGGFFDSLVQLSSSSTSVFHQHRVSWLHMTIRGNGDCVWASLY